MSWRETDPMRQRIEFIGSYLSGCYSITELSECFGISRKTAYKWIARFEADGLDGLQEQSRRPKHSPSKTDATIEQRLLGLRREHPHWGPLKLRSVLEAREPALLLPAPSTIAAMLKRGGLVEARRVRHHWPHSGSTPLRALRPNEVWCCDFKGEFLLGNGRYCYPLTVTDAFSRMLLECRALHSTAFPTAHATFKRLFRECGLPDAIRSDNGPPFASVALGGLSRLNLWWLKLGIDHQRIRPGRPQENGRHERMHRTLAAEATRPPSANHQAQQRRFRRYCQYYNHERPHQALGQKTPASLYRAPERSLPERLPAPEYPAHYQQRLVSSGGTIKFNGAIVFLSDVLTGEQVGLVETDDGLWSIYIYHRLLGKLDERTLKIT